MSGSSSSARDLQDFGRKVISASCSLAVRQRTDNYSVSTSYLDGTSSSGLRGGHTSSSAVIVWCMVGDLVFGSMRKTIVHRPSPSMVCYEVDVLAQVFEWNNFASARNIRQYILGIFHSCLG